MKSLLVGMIVLLASLFCCEAAVEVNFVKGPTAKVVGNKTRIEFELSAEADVAVYITDKQGKVIRRLVAGVLGPHAPAPLKVGSLSQSIEWDGKDDAGKAAQGGPFSVRVVAGMGAEYAGTAFGSKPRPNEMRNVIGMGVGNDGRLYVLSERWRRAWWRHTAIHVFRRNGDYEKTIKPFPSSISPDRVAKLTPFKTDDDKPFPVVYRVLSMSYYPKEDLPQHMAVTPDGNIHFAVDRAAYRKPASKWLATLDPDGGVPLDSYTGGLMPSETSAGAVHLASSSDGKSLFATGLERGPGESSRTRPNRPVIHRIGLPTRAKAEVFFGSPKTPGSDETHLKNPKGLAVDGKGRLFVADEGNNRVVVLGEATGAFKGTFEVPGASWVGVHRKSGAVYVKGKSELIKFVVDEACKAEEQGRLKLPVLSAKAKSRAAWYFAVDPESDPAVIWVGLNMGGEALMRCEEKNGTFGPLKKAGYEKAFTYWNLCTAPDRTTVACKVGHYGLRILHEDTGKTRDLKPTGSAGQTYRMGPNGQIYGMDHWKWGIRRWDKNGIFMPYPLTKDHKELKGRLPNAPTGTTSWERDFDVDRHGNVYVKQRGKVYHGRMRVDKYDNTGKFLGTLVWVVSDGSLGPRVDAVGNIYIADSIRPVGKHVPDYFAGRLPKVKIDKRGSPLQQYRWMYGSVIKFGPEGGAIWFPILDAKRDVYGFDGEAKLPAGQTKVKVDTAQGDRTAVKTGELQGALWYRYGCAYLLDMHPGHNRRCHCTSTEFEVDDFGRSFYTDQGRFRVVILDTNGNEILAFGQYGNQDSCGPEIAFNWFVGLGVTDRYVYVADGSNRRVVRVKLTYAVDETAAVK